MKKMARMLTRREANWNVHTHLATIKMGIVILEGNLFPYAMQYYEAVKKNEMSLYVIWKDV